MSPDSRASLLDALLVYAEPLASDARVVVLGGARAYTPTILSDRLLESGARSVHVYEPDGPASSLKGGAARARELDVRDGAFDLAIIPDLGALPEAEAVLARVRRAVGPNGAVVAMARARTGEGSEDVFPDMLAPSRHAYAELYDLFAIQFESVTMTGVLPFQGIVFAQLGLEDDEAPAVSVDTRLAEAESPQVFVVVASHDVPEIDPYAIVQIERDALRAPPHREPVVSDEAVAQAAAFAAMQIKAELLASQLEETRRRLSNAEARVVDVRALELLVAERDAAMTRALELEAVLGTAQQAIGALERRLLDAEKGMLERDDQIATLHGELDARVEPDALAPVLDPALVEELTERMQRAESALALNVADLAHVAEAHASETATLEAQLRDRARVIAGLEKEIARREHLVRELVTTLEEAREGGANGVTFEAAPPLPMVSVEDHDRLKKKLDDLAGEVARREGELVARGWRITELENERKRLTQVHADVPPVQAKPAAPKATDGELARVQDELDALRQALTQEHAARVRAESGEELARARAEIAQQAVLLEQMRARVS